MKKTRQTKKIVLSPLHKKTNKQVRSRTRNISDELNKIHMK